MVLPKAPVSTNAPGAPPFDSVRPLIETERVLRRMTTGATPPSGPRTTAAWPGHERILTPLSARLSVSGAGRMYIPLRRQAVLLLPLRIACTARVRVAKGLALSPGPLSLPSGETKYRLGGRAAGVTGAFGGGVAAAVVTAAAVNATRKSRWCKGIVNDCSSCWRRGHRQSRRRSWRGVGKALGRAQDRPWGRMRAIAAHWAARTSTPSRVVPLFNAQTAT